MNEERVKNLKKEWSNIENWQQANLFIDAILLEALESEDKLEDKPTKIKQLRNEFMIKWDTPVEQLGFFREDLQVVSFERAWEWIEEALKPEDKPEKCGFCDGTGKDPAWKVRDNFEKEDKQIEEIDYEKIWVEGNRTNGTRNAIIMVARKTDELTRAINKLNNV